MTGAQARQVMDLVRATEHAALHRENPLQVPGWCREVRRILDEPGQGCGCPPCDGAYERAARLGVIWEGAPA